MKKRLIILILSIFIMPTAFANSYDLNQSTVLESNANEIGNIIQIDNNTNTENESKPSCDKLLGDPDDNNSPAYYLQTAFDIIKYIAIVAFLVLSAGDVAKTVLSENKEMSKEITRKILFRLIYVICIFFIPDILKAILTATKIYGDCGIS